jgi:hypothetical protein
MNLSRTLRNTNHISELQNRVFILHVIKDAHILIDIFFLISLLHLIHAINSAAYKKQTLSHKLELSTHHHSSNEPHKNLVAIGTDSISRCKSYYQMIDAIMTKSMVNINLEYIKSI